MISKTIMILAIAAAFVAGTLTTATIVSAEGDTIIACVHNTSQGNNVRIVESVDDCKNYENPLEWNIQGPPGADGMDGFPGANGIDGINGINGAPGPGLSCENQEAIEAAVPGFVIDPECNNP